MESIAEAFRMKLVPDEQFGCGIFASDPSHHAAARRRIDDIGHQAASKVCWVEPFLSCMTAGFMIRAISAMTGTTTELPNCL